MYNYDRSVLHRRIGKTALCLTGIISLTVFSSRVQAQLSTPPSAIGNTAPPNFDSLPDRGFDNVQPVRQQNFLIDSRRGSQQFFRQGDDKLYLLPESKSEPILKIDEALKTEEVNRQYLPDNSTQE